MRLSSAFSLPLLLWVNCYQTFCCFLCFYRAKDKQPISVELKGAEKRGWKLFNYSECLFCVWCDCFLWYRDFSFPMQVWWLFIRMKLEQQIRGRRSNCIAPFVSKTVSVREKEAVPIGSLLWIFFLQNSSFFGPSLHFLLIRFLEDYPSSYQVWKIFKVDIG